MDAALSEEIYRELDRQEVRFVSELSLFETHLNHKISKNRLKRIETEVVELPCSEPGQNALKSNFHSNYNNIGDMG